MTAQQELTDLNIQIADMEKRRDNVAEDFFKEVLSTDLIFRRASGVIEGKGSFLDGLKQPYPFADLKTEDIQVRRVEGLNTRAVVTLMIVGRRADGSQGYYRNVRLFSKADDTKYKWRLEFWYNYELTPS
jgi:hypothetical protein